MSQSPTPWRLDADGDIIAANQVLVAIVPCKDDRAILAAAPDLLEFAQHVAQVAKNHGNQFIQAWAESVCAKAGFPVTLKDEPDFVAGGVR